MTVFIERNQQGLEKASANYLNDLECYEVEIIKNELPCDTTYRIELIDNDYLNVTVNELRGLKKLLDNKDVCKLLGIEVK